MFVSDSRASCYRKGIKS